MENLGAWIFMLSIPTFMICGWILLIMFGYKGKLSDRLSEWYHESDGDL